MRSSNRNYAATVPFVEALAKLGLRHVAITPGSRNTPLAFAFAAEEGIEDTSHHDERSASFFALGMAKSTRNPVALVCTSGTAAAEYLPAIVEARNSRIPLIVLTADRPPELRDVGAQQTVDQAGMYGRAVKWFHEAPVPEAQVDNVATFVALAGRAWSAAIDVPMGPVHINMSFRDPMAPVVVPGDAPALVRDVVFPTFSDAEPLAPSQSAIDSLLESMEGSKALLVAGPTEDSSFAPAAATFAAKANLPIIADPLSGLRAGHHDLANVIATGDWLARRGDLDSDLRPDVILRFGAIPTSKSMSKWLSHNADVTQIVIDDAGWRDPGASAASVVRADATATASALTGQVDSEEGEWARVWRVADQEVADLLEVEYPSEPAVVQALQSGLPDGAALYVASSMPIRLMDAYFRPVDRDIRVLGNRGANGIDGLISSSLGAAIGLSRSTYVFTGDLSLLHDVNALLTVARMNVPLTIVLINNDGGGIFHLLPQVEFAEHFEKHLGTPHGLDFAKIADAFGIDHSTPETAEHLTSLIATPATSPRMIEIQTNRAETADLLRAMWKRVGHKRPPA